MPDGAKFKKRLMRKSILISLLILCGSFTIVFVYEVYVSQTFNRSAFIFTVGMGLVMVLIMLRFMFPKEKASYLTDRYPPELDRIAVAFQKEADELIFQHLGQETFQQMMQEEFRNTDGTCQKWLAGEAAQADPDLRCYLLARLANAYIKEDVYERAAACLGEALSIKPDNLLLNLRLAEVHEALGCGEEAIHFYQIASDQASSAKIQAYLNNQIKRVKTRGPRKATPMPGFRYMVG